MKAKELFERLASEDFEATVWPAPTAQRLRHLLLRTPEVRDVREALASGALSDEDIRDFVSNSLLRLRRGTRFDLDIALASLAVALESYFSPVADEYLTALAGLTLPELTLAIQVAKESLRQRTNGTTTAKVFSVKSIDVPLISGEEVVVSSQKDEPDMDSETTYEEYPEIAYAEA